MKISRRAFFGLTAASLGAVTLGVGGGVGGWTFTSFEGRLRGFLQQSFGADIANDPETSLFLRDFIADLAQREPSGFTYTHLRYRLQRDFLPWGASETETAADFVVNAFLRATNVVRAHETGAPLIYVALFYPYKSPCTNMLGANWL